MIETTNKKHLRFPEFENNSVYDWRNDMVLNDVAYLVKGKFLYTDLTIHNYISTDNMLPDFGGVSVASKIPTKGTLNGFENGDILFSNIRTYLKKAWQSEFKGACNSDVLVFRTKDKEILSNNFLYIILTHSSFTAYSNATSKGTKMPRGNKQAMLNYNMAIPHKDEQQKIAGFLSVVDKRIALLQAKYDHLQKYKTGILQKIFTQQIRFKQPNGMDYPDWESKTLGDITYKESSSLNMGSVAENGQYEVYGASGICGKTDTYISDNKYIGIVKDGAGVGNSYLCNEKTSILGTLDKIDIIDDNNIIYVYYLLSQINFKRYIIGSTIPHIYYKEYKNYKCFIPCLDEQQKIADFLSALDKKITNTQNQLTKTKSFKSGLLQKMFI